jgi:23S rRNA (cytosine1962-C5)-methyltransferase
MPRIVLKPGHVQPVWAGHPWVYAQAVDRVEGGAAPGDEVDVVDPRGNFLGRGLYSPRSAIPVRLYTRSAARRIDVALLERRLERAITRRRALGLPSAETTAYRVVHAEGDALPGLIVDRYGDVLVVQFATIGIKRRERDVLDGLSRLLAPRAIVDRSSERTARLEGFEAGSGVVEGDATLAELDFLERGLRWRIPLSVGQKTGFYLDQRELRARIERLAAGRSVFDAFCFVGAFALAAARGGAQRVVAVDESALALEIGAECARLNGLSGRVVFERARAEAALTRAGTERRFELVVVDPPKLAPTRASRQRGADVLRRLAAAGCRATAPGGLLLACSCSAALGLEALARSVALGARDAAVDATVLERHFQGPDHPTPAAFAEGVYLSALLIEVGPE